MKLPESAQLNPRNDDFCRSQISPRSGGVFQYDTRNSRSKLQLQTENSKTAPKLTYKDLKLTGHTQTMEIASQGSQKPKQIQIHMEIQIQIGIQIQMEPVWRSRTSHISFNRRASM